MSGCERHHLEIPRTPELENIIYRNSPTTTGGRLINGFTINRIKPFPRKLFNNKYDDKRRENRNAKGTVAKTETYNDSWMISMYSLVKILR